MDTTKPEGVSEAAGGTVMAELSSLSTDDLLDRDREAAAREGGDWEGSGSPLESFYERWSDVVDELHRRGVAAPSDD